MSSQTQDGLYLLSNRRMGEAIAHPSQNYCNEENKGR